jgi:hypothetical protein
MVGKAGELNEGRNGRVLGPLEQCPPECPIHHGDGQITTLLFKFESFGSIPLCIDKIYVSV